MRKWAACPICSSPDMRWEPDDDGWAVYCTNLACRSNGGKYDPLLVQSDAEIASLKSQLEARDGECQEHGCQCAAYQASIADLERRIAFLKSECPVERKDGQPGFSQAEAYFWKSKAESAQKERIQWLDFPANYPAPGKWPIVLNTMPGWFEGFWGTDAESSAKVWEERGVTHWLKLELPAAMEAENG